MKHLYCNFIEVPETIRLVSSCFGIEVEYHPWDSGGKPVVMDDLFTLAKSNCFEVQVLLTSHNDAYVKTSKKATVGTAVEGWVNLAHYDSISGSLKNQYCQKIIPPVVSPMERYAARAYLEKSMRGLVDLLDTDDFEEVKDFMWRNVREGLNCYCVDMISGSCDGYYVYADDYNESIVSIDEILTCESFN